MMTTEELLARLERLLLRLERQQPASPAAGEKGYFTLKEAAAFVGLSVGHLRRAIRAGRLRCGNVGRSWDRPTYRISREDLAAWLQAAQTPRSPSPAAGATSSRHHRNRSG